MADTLSSRDSSPYRRVSTLLAAILLTVLQTAAVSHLISHSVTGDTGGCELCLNAVHGGDALVAAATLPTVFPVLVDRFIAGPKLRVSSQTPAVYRARGPPSFA